MLAARHIPLALVCLCLSCTAQWSSWPADGAGEGGPCSPTSCAQGCCAGNRCEPGTENNACGWNGSPCLICPQEAHCVVGECILDEIPAACAYPRCPGCCQDNHCQGGTINERCGRKGNACVDCTASGLVCRANGTCDQPCAPNCAGKCAGATDGCGGTCAQNACAGCCDINHDCHPGDSNDSCGKSGSLCKSCAPGACQTDGTCKGGTCTPDCTNKCIGASNGCEGTCTTNHCSGCCDGSHACQSGTSDSACGSNGDDCQDCSPGLCSAHICTEPCAPRCAGKCNGQDDGCGKTCLENQCTGCCDINRDCQAGTTHAICGKNGDPCDTCSFAETCTANTCVHN